MSNFKIVTDQPTIHGVLGGPEDLVPPEECPDGTWELWKVLWDCWSQGWVCDGWFLGFLWCTSGHYESLYRYTAVWKCSSTGVVRVTSKEKKVEGGCRVFG